MTPIVFHSRRVTGAPLNEHNVPMMLPNGQIFGQKVIYPSFVALMCFNTRRRRFKSVINMLLFLFRFRRYEQALSQISKENGIIVCPKTNDLFVQPKIEKVYVM